MNASFAEKSVWIQLAGIVLGLGVYFIAAGRLLAAGVNAMSEYAVVFMVAVVCLLVFQIAGHVLAAVTARPEQRDERDRLIMWRSRHNASWLIAAGVLISVICMLLGVANVWTANLLLFSLALSETLNLVLKIVYYRRGV